ncbi:MAG: alpha-mannosidase [Bacteroidales bacterium]|nr:alpha-mannosidase [Bacteroidales bacterium]
MKKQLITTAFLLALSLTLSARQGGFIRDWLVLGSFPCTETHKLLERDYLNGEADQAPTEGMTFGGHAWQLMQAGQNGLVNLLMADFEQTDYCAAYAFSCVYAPEEQNALLLSGSDDGIAIWVNGLEVHRNNVFRGWRPDQDRVIIRLGQGWNRILVKAVNGTGGFGFSLGLCGLDNLEIPGLRTSATNPFGNATFEDPDVKPWPVCRNASFADHFAVTNPMRYLPLTLDLTLAGTPSISQLKVITYFRNAENKMLLNKQTIVEPYQGGMLSMPLNPTDLLLIVHEVTHADVRLEWEDQYASYNGFPVNPESFLWAVLHTGRDALPASINDVISFLTENLPWIPIFRPEAGITHRDTISGILECYLHDDWERLDPMLRRIRDQVMDISADLKKEHIWFTGNAHIDMAWLWKSEETVQVCYETFASAIGFADKYPEFVFCQSSAQTYWWMEQRFPQLFARIQEKIQSGQWELTGGMWVEPDLNIPSGEALARQLLYGKRYFIEKFGVDIQIGFNPDSFGYCWTLPQLYRKAGIKSFITQKITWNDTNKFPHKLFWWRAPDGSSILAVFPFTYVHNAEPQRIAAEFLEHREASSTRDQLVLYGVGNHGGGPTQENIDRIHYMQQLDAFPAVSQSSTLDFVDTVLMKYGDLPEWNDELYLEYHRGTYTTQAQTKKNNRLSEIRLEEAEKLAVISDIPYPWDELNEAWRLTMFNQFHDILPGSSINEVYVDAEVQYDNVRKLTARVMDRSLMDIMQHISFPEGSFPLVVFNPLSFERSDPFTVKLPDGFSGNMGLFALNGEEIPYEITGNQMVVSDIPIPSTGYRAFYLREGRNRHVDSTLRVGKWFLENEHLRVEINPSNGNIRSMIYKPGNREIIAETGEGNVLMAFEDIPEHYDAWNIGYTGKKWTIGKVADIRILEDNLSRVAIRVVRRDNRSEFIQDYILLKGMPRLDIATIADWHEEHVLLKAAFDWAVDNDSATYEIPFGTICRPSVWRNSIDSARFEVCGHKWIDLTDEDAAFGVSLLNDCKYGFDVQRNRMRITLLRSPKSPNPEADMGKHSFTYSVYPHPGDWRSGETYRRAYELNYPLISRIGPRCSLSTEGSSNPPSMSLLQMDQPNILVSAVKKAEDNDGIIIRLYETHGHETDVSLRFAAPVVEAMLTDLIERPERMLETEGNLLKLHFSPHEIVTLKIVQ